MSNPHAVRRSTRPSYSFFFGNYKLIKMKKTISLLLLTLCLQASAQHVTKDAAQAKAVEFLNQQRANPMKKVGAVLVPTAFRLLDKAPRQMKVPSQKAQADAPYYIFNASDGQGYVIVSGDERAQEVLGYSDIGHLSEETMPCGMKMLLDLYAEEINSLPNIPQQEEGQAEAKEPMAAPKKIRMHEPISVLWCHANGDRARRIMGNAPQGVAVDVLLDVSQLLCRKFYIIGATRRDMI